MGLDTVELVMAWEEAFGVEIPDTVAAQLTTPREVIDYLAAQLGASRQPACLTHRGFHRLRRVLTTRFGIARSEIRPATSLDQVLPSAQRRSAWQALGADVGAAQWPELVRPNWLVWLLLLGVPASLGITIFAAKQSSSSTPTLAAVLLGIVIAALVGYASAVITRPLRKEFPAEQDTIGGLARYLAGYNPQLFAVDPSKWTRERIAIVVRQVIVQEIGVTDFHEDSNFVRDIRVS